ncbi:trifunctional histidinol dehydrogenase [Dispira simplex]|nr:trifunctional histidinol dehydrogenase [Dispira simplex]
MLIPWLPLPDSGLVNSSPLVTALACLPTVAVTASTEAALLPVPSVSFPSNSRGSLWTKPLVATHEHVLALLNGGFAKLVTPYPCPAIDENVYATIPSDRRIIRLVYPGTEHERAVHSTKAMEEHAKVASGVIFHFTDPQLVGENLIKLLVVHKRPPGFSVGIEADNLPVTILARLATEGFDAHMASARFTLDYPAPEPLINLAEAFLAGTQSDRQDHLLPTVVVDPQHTNLGLVYSSVQSVSEALRTGSGVYQSRKRGLWYKGETSGAKQKLLGINLDCDTDALELMVEQQGAGFCHLNRASCFGNSAGLSRLMETLQKRKTTAVAGSYTQRLFNDSSLLHSKIMEEADELVQAATDEDIAWEAADLIYFALTKCVAHGLTLLDVEQQLDRRAAKVTRRPGNAKPQWLPETKTPKYTQPETPLVEPTDRIEMPTYSLVSLDESAVRRLLLRPIIQSDSIAATVEPIVREVRTNGDQALKHYTEKFDKVQLQSTVLKAPFPQKLMAGMTDKVRRAIDQAYDNIRSFHEAQLLSAKVEVETMPGVVCSRFSRPIERVGLYVPGGSAVLPSSALMLGVPAQVAGCREITLATPPRRDGSMAPEVLYAAEKVGASTVVLAGGAQAVAAMAYGTESVPKVDKICGPGNQFVTAAKMMVQNDHSAMVAIDMPAGPSELLVIADENANPAYVASDLLSQAEHGPDSQVVLVTVSCSPAQEAAIADEIDQQASRLPREGIVRQSIPKSFTLRVPSRKEAIDFSNAYAPEHLILHVDDPQALVPFVNNAGSVFVGPYSPESCGDYASGTNHTLPTYGYSRMYSGVNTDTFLKHITSQTLTAEGLDRIGDTVMALAEVEKLEAHRNAVAIRLADLRQ